jgi:hypothetical protein
MQSRDATVDLVYSVQTRENCIWREMRELYLERHSQYNICSRRVQGLYLQHGHWYSTVQYSADPANARLEDLKLMFECNLESMDSSTKPDTIGYRKGYG